MAKKSRVERIKDTIRAILKKEIKHNPWAERKENYGYFCPWCEDARMEFSYDQGFDPDTVSVYECENCKREISTDGIFRINDAYKAMQGEDPFQGEIWVDSEKNYWWQPAKHDWTKIVAEIKREIEQEKSDES